MTKFAIAVLCAVALAQPTRSVAGDIATGSVAKPTSFVPHPHTNQHVYGAPIQPPIVNHSKPKHAPKKQSSRTANRVAQ